MPIVISIADPNWACGPDRIIMKFELVQALIDLLKTCYDDWEKMQS